MQGEYEMIMEEKTRQNSVKFQGNMMMAIINGIEFLNNRFDPFDIKLEGWSESVHENVEDFDEIFEELYDKYKDRGKMSPEMRLIMAVGGSGFMCHVSNSFFRSKMPSMDDVLKNNPQLARQMAAAAAQQAGPGFGNFMGMAMGVPQTPQMPQMPQVPGQGFPGNSSATGGFFSSSSAPPQMPPAQTQRPVARREMSGPTGVDDILKTFDEVRASEAAAAASMTGFQNANGVLTQPAVAAAMSSRLSDDGRSIADSALTGATNTLKPRRRRAQPPVGNTVSLDV
jgi:hypothetical protein